MLIIAHGDPDSEREAADMQAERLSAMLSIPVHVAYLYSDRGMDGALGDISAEMPDRIVVLPFFMTLGLFTGRVGLEEGVANIFASQCRTLKTGLRPPDK